MAKAAFSSGAGGGGGGGDGKSGVGTGGSGAGYPRDGGGGGGTHGGAVNLRTVPGRLDMPNPGEKYDWVQCESCEKWRRLPCWVSPPDEAASWYCKDNTWSPLEANCSVPQEVETWLTAAATIAKLLPLR